MPDAIGPYTIVRELGRGGMGIVYEGWDARLSRPVAIKTILNSADTQMRERFIREARAAAAVSHPHICQLFDIGEHNGEPFLAMELLEGQSLGDRLRQGPMTVKEAATTGLAILSALAALHRRGLVHRDLKPSNVFLTSHGVKLLDFGLARRTAFDRDETSLTVSGVVMGSPRYMAPEQVRGEEVDSRADIFAAGVLLFEMLSGRTAFSGISVIDVLHAVIHEQIPPLLGSPAIVDLDRVVQRAVAKSAADRYPTADEMAADLRAGLSRSSSSETAQARATKRLVVLPFKVLRPDPAVDFLSYSLADAITVALSAIDSLTIRSSLTAARFADGPPDLRKLASELGVDAAITGTLLHAGSAVRVAVQLIDVPSGTVHWSHAAQVSLDDLFTIQDSVCSAIVNAFALPLTAKEHAMMRHDVPANPDAYECYLRANRLSTNVTQWTTARDLYLRSVNADPSYAPAWARLGRILRNIGKYMRTPEAALYLAQAEDAFQRAFQVNADLPLAHNLYTYQEVDSGRALDAVLRLLGRLRTRTNDPDLFAGLVHASRYVGLLDASVAAYHLATRLDPAIATSAHHSFFMLGEYQRAIEVDPDHVPYVSIVSHIAMGQRSEAVALCENGRAAADSNPHLRLMLNVMESLVTDRFDEGRRALEQLNHFPGFNDPEGWYYWAQAAAGVKDTDFAIALLQRSVSSGFHCLRAFETTPLLDNLRGTPQFAEVLSLALTAHEAAAAAFAKADGHRLLGLPRP